MTEEQWREAIAHFAKLGEALDAAQVRYQEAMVFLEDTAPEEWVRRYDEDLEDSLTSDQH